MRRKTAVILGVSGAALALTASSAFTAGGLTVTSGNGFIGGTQNVTITGTTVGNIAYVADSTTASKTGKIVLTFDDHNANGKTPAIAINFTGSGAPTDWTCSAIDTSTSVASKSVSECGGGSTVTGAAGTAFTTSSLASIDLTVS